MAHATLSVTFRYSFVVVHTAGIHAFVFLFIRCFLEITKETSSRVIMFIVLVNTIKISGMWFLVIR